MLTKLHEQHTEPIFSCENEDINHLSYQLHNILDCIRTELPPIKKIEEEYSVWDHVPNLGKRYEFVLFFNNSFVNDRRYYCGVGESNVCDLFDVEGLSAELLEKQIELSISVTPNSIFFTTYFLKKKKAS